VRHALGGTNMQRRPPTFIDQVVIAYRATSYDVPVWVSPNRREGRWNIANQEPIAQYMSLDAEAPFAEMLRHENLRSELDASHYRTTIWQLRVDSGAIVDYSTFELADAAGFDPEALVSDDYGLCQAEARWLVSHNARGVLAPSAALPGSTNLTLFGPRVRVRWGTRVKLASSVPAQPISTGAPPAGLTERVRYYGQREPRLEKYMLELNRGKAGGCD
jgi:RES domain-containing protein